MPTRAETLRAQADRLEALFASEDDGSKAAALSRELRAVLAELEQLEPKRSGSTRDEIAERRAARIAASAGADEAGVGERGSGTGSN